jgi:ribosome-binding protein aMBF1 (putative translation factor)
MPPSKAPRVAVRDKPKGDHRRPAPPPGKISVDITSRFGRRVAGMREELDMSQEAFAKMLGVNRTYISDLERGRRSIGLPMLEVFALGLDMTVSELLRRI